jgi:hypothetical protein
LEKLLEREKKKSYWKDVMVITSFPPWEASRPARLESMILMITHEWDGDIPSV